MVTKEPELEAWGLYGVQAPHGLVEVELTKTKHDAILQNKVKYKLRYRKKRIIQLNYILLTKRELEYFNKSSHLTD